MATPAFGFSVGDFISAINLVNKVRKSLKDVGGAASEYQSAVIELENLATTLSHLEALQPNEDNIQHVNAIRAMSMACKIPLEEFMRKMTRYESSLGPLAKQKSLHSIYQKTKWSVTFAEDVEKLRALVAAKHVSINILLGLQTSKTLNKMNTEMRSSVQGLEEKIASHHAILHSVQERTQSIDERTKLAQIADQRRLESLGAGVDKIDQSVIQARQLGQQIMETLNTFSRTIQRPLQAVLQSNFQTYLLMLQMQRNISRKPTNLLESNIKFEDALGEIRQLPYEYFRHWEPFEGFLRAHFRHKPGESKIMNSQYHIIDSANENTIINKDHWSRYIREGATISMSMIMSYIKIQSRICPRPGCSGATSRAEGTSNTFYCNTCRLEFFKLESNLEDSFGRINVLSEDEEVSEKQIAEDISLYGSRPNPPDAVEVDEYTQLSNLPQKRSAAEFDAAVSRPAKARRKMESKGFNYERVTAIDWNSGATPLDAWLNQSAVPSVLPLPQAQTNLSGSPIDNLAAAELEDLKAFRTIHIEAMEEPESIEKCRNPVIDLTILEPREQIFLRNILDRYPLLPAFLALRLAKANCARADRLDLKRQNGGHQLTSNPVQISGHDHSPPSKTWSPIDNVTQDPKPSGRTQDGRISDLPPPKTSKPRPHTCTTCDKSFTRLEHLKRHERSHTKEKPYPCDQCTRCFARRDLLLKHQQNFHLTTPSSSYEFKYNVTLNAPTAMVSQAGETPVTYLNKGQIYTLNIHDTGHQNLGLPRYRTVVGISFDDEQQRQNPLATWQNWHEGRGLAEGYQHRGERLAVEYLGLDTRKHWEMGQPSIKIETASFDHFSVTWSPPPKASTVSCSILIRFNFLSTDFCHSKGFKGAPARLCTKTGTLPVRKLTLRSGSTDEVCFCKIKLYSDHFAERKLSNDLAHIKKSIDKVEQQIALTENDETAVGSASKSDNYQSDKVSKRKQTSSVSSQGFNRRSTTEDDHSKLAKLRHMLNSTRPTSWLNVRGGEQDDPDDSLVPFPGNPGFRQQCSPSIVCTICSKPDHQHRNYCPNRKSGPSSSHVNTGFWTDKDSRSRAASVQSHSSERNSSLHGSGRFDFEDQELDFPDDRSRRSSAGFSELSATFPPPPVNISKERSSHLVTSKESIDQDPKLLRFSCDICEQEIEVLRRRDWQIHVLRDLRPYVCTVEDCDKPTLQFTSRRSHLQHEMTWHKLGLRESDNDMERKLGGKQTLMCVFCGEPMRGKNNRREKHVGRHMEEIAFAVVRKPYEEWEFYSDSSGQVAHNIELDSQANA